MFQTSILRKYLNLLNDHTTQKAYEKFTEIFLNPEKQENIRHSSESQYQEGFCRDMFCLCLGYTINPEPGYNLKTEQRNQTASSDKYDNRKADAAIILNDKVVAVIELKGCDTIDLGKVENQAFGYRAHNSGCKYVIISNFERLRFYIDDASDYLEFNLFSLSYEEFRKLYLVLALEQIKNEIPAKLKAESFSKEKDITAQFYKDYSGFKRRLFENICRNNIDSGACPTVNNLSPDSGACPAVNSDDDKLLLFRKTQKLLDRLLFIFFCEDRGLIPANTIAHIIKGWKQLKSLDAYQPLYNRFKLEFSYINEGHDDPDKFLSVFAYNGGLFKPDKVLDNLIIDDDILLETQKLSDYDFESDVSVDILGHIFEHSLTEIEEIQQQIVAEREGIKLDKKKEKTGKRKKDGVFYTPAYITKYIVENTIGRLCNEKKKELHIDDETFSQRGAVAGRKNSKAYKDEIANRKQLDDVLDQYKDWLLSLKICDPACGSGAFLNAALSFLKSEHHLIDTYRAHIYGHTLMFQYVDDQILENNLYGVDINEESVEIAKLSLWLHTARPGRKLTSLNNNIKCGNSLIDDPAVAGNNAFNWQKEFPTVFRPKIKKAWHITTATHDSRTSQRMVDYRVRELRDNGTRPNPEPVWLSLEEEKIITETVAKIVREDKLNVLAYNICGDHMHLILVCEEREVTNIVRKIKSNTARIVNMAMGRTVSTRGQAPLSGDENNPLSGDENNRDMTRGLAPLSNELYDRADLSTRGQAPLSGDENNRDMTRGLAPLSNETEVSTRGNTQCALWAQKYGYTELDTDEHLYNAIEYVKNNRKKHNLPPLDVEYPKCVSVKEAFRPEFTGGFDVVIGNPPYGAEFNKQEKKYIANMFKSYRYKYESYVYFIELGLKILKKDSYLEFITPSMWMTLDEAFPIRKMILENDLKTLRFYGEGAFVDAVVNTSSFMLTKKSPQNKLFVIKQNNQKFEYQKNIIVQNGYKLLLSGSPSELQLVCKINDHSSPLSTFGTVIQGITPYDKARGQSKEIIKSRAYHHSQKIDETCGHWIEGSDLSRYNVSWSGTWLSYGEWLAAPREKKYFEGGRLLFREIPGTSKRIQASYIDSEAYYGHSISPFIARDSSKDNLLFILSIANSTITSWYGRLVFPNFSKDIFPKINPADISSIPIVSCMETERNKLSSLADAQLVANENLQTITQKFLNLAKESLGLSKITETLGSFYKYEFKVFLDELKKQKVSLELGDKAEWLDYFNQCRQDCTRLLLEIEENDRQIDKLVYALYGLTDEEIEVVEGKQIKEEIE